MKLSDLYPSKYLSAADLDGPTTVRIRDVVMEELQVRGKPSEWKPKLNLVGIKPLVLNKTNAKAIGKLHGDDTDRWCDKLVTLYPSETPFGDEMVACIRVQDTVPSDEAPPPPDHEPAAGLSDELPI